MTREVSLLIRYVAFAFQLCLDPFYVCCASLQSTFAIRVGNFGALLGDCKQFSHRNKQDQGQCFGEEMQYMNMNAIVAQLRGMRSHSGKRNQILSLSKNINAPILTTKDKAGSTAIPLPIIIGIKPVWLQLERIFLYSTKHSHSWWDTFFFKCE